jgi:hypothetical protein
VSSYTIEKILWDIVDQTETAEAFRINADAFLDRYPLDPSERDLLKDMDVRTIVALRINPMLLMRAYQSIYGRDKRPEYLRRLAETKINIPAK